jgi:hypothetical protein
MCCGYKLSSCLAVVATQNYVVEKRTKKFCLNIDADHQEFVIALERDTRL